jgi:hypothetical protein
MGEIKERQLARGTAGSGIKPSRYVEFARRTLVSSGTAE